MERSGCPVRVLYVLPRWRDWCYRWAVCASALTTMLQVAAGATSAEMQKVRLTLEKPRLLVESTQHKCWFPDLLQFSTGELMLNHSLNSDSNANLHNSQAVYLSNDGGRTFPMTYDVNGFHNAGGEPRVCLPDGRIVGVSTFLRASPAGQKRKFVAHRWTYERGGRQYRVEPWGAEVSGIPREVISTPAGPSRTWWFQINWFADILPIAKDRWLSTISLRFIGDQRESTVAVESRDEGRTWQYLSTIAGPDSVNDATEGFDEPCLVQLADGDVMCISRVGTGETQKLARTYSRDGGATWSDIDRLPAYSVAPQVLRLANGTLVLSTGRPGVFLWFSVDGRGKTWEPFDVIKHHNQSVGARLRIAHTQDLSAYASDQIQTTAYTAMVERSPNRVMLVYDRVPNGWGEMHRDNQQSSEVFALEFSVDRDP